MVKSYLKEGQMTQVEWNNEIMPLVDKGKLKQRLDLIKPGFLIIFQGFRGYLQDTDGKVYRCTGWSPPNDKPYVEVKEVK
jgi:hypothetical protein